MGGDACRSFWETEPWASLDAFARGRLGTVPLTKGLGEILFALISKRLPELLTEVDDHLSACERDFAEPPMRSIGDPVGEVWRLLSNFNDDVQELLAGRPDDGARGLFQMDRVARQEFREAIFKGAPRFRPWTKPSTGIELVKVLASSASVIDTSEDLRPFTPLPLDPAEEETFD